MSDQTGVGGGVGGGGGGTYVFSENTVLVNFDFFKGA